MPNGADRACPRSCAALRTRGRPCWLTSLLARVDVTRRFGGLTAVDRVSLDARARRGARRDRHQRRRQVDARQRARRRAAADRRDASQLHGRDVTRWSQPRRARARHRAQLPAHDDLSALHGVRELPARGAGAPPARRCDLRSAAAALRAKARASRTRDRAGRPHRADATASPARCRTARSASSRSRCASRPRRRCCCSTSRSPAWAPRKPSACWRCSPR